MLTLEEVKDKFLRGGRRDPFRLHGSLSEMELWIVRIDYSSCLIAYVNPVHFEKYGEEV